MRMLQTAIVLAITLLIATAGVAQEKQKKKRGAGTLTPSSRLMLRMQVLRKATETLDLTSEQEEQFSELREKLGPKMKEIYGKLMDVMTAEQQASAQEEMQAARDAGKEGRAVFVAVEKAIKLTDEQKEQMAPVDKEIMKLQRRMMKQVNGILTPEQRKKLAEKIAPKRKDAAKKKGANKKAAKKKGAKKKKSQ